MRGQENEYKRRNVQPLVVLAQQAFQLKSLAPGDVPAPVLFDPVATVSATYGVAYQNQFRDGPWSSRPAIFLIDSDGVIRHVDSVPDQDIREEGILPALDDLEEQRRLITALESKDEERRVAARAALAPLSTRTASAIPVLVKSLMEQDAEIRAGAAAALLWIAPRAEEAIPALTAVLKDDDARVRRLAAMTLGRLGAGAKAAVPTLIQRLKDEDARVRAEALAALERIGPAAVAGCIKR